MAGKALGMNVQAILMDPTLLVKPEVLAGFTELVRQRPQIKVLLESMGVDFS